MKKLTALALAAALAAMAGPALAQARDEARSRDLQRLQEDLVNLDEELAALEPGDAEADAYRQRAEEIREDTIYLKVKARRHQRAGGEGTGISYDEVAEMRRSIADLRDDLASAFSPVERELRLAEGTRIEVRLDERVSSQTARREDRIEASVLRPVSVRGRLALPAGTRVRAIVKDVEPAQRPSKGGKLSLDFDAIYLERSRLDVRSRVVSIDDETSSDTAKKAGIGAAVGGVLGAILGGKKGALVGVLVGGGGAVAANKGEEVELPPGTVVTLSLEKELVIPSDRR